MGVPLTHMVPGLQNGSGAASFPMAALGGRPPIFTAPGPQVAACCLTFLGGLDIGH